jgi:glucokinase
MLVYALDIGGSSIKHGLVEAVTGNRKTVIDVGTTPLRSNKFSDLEQDVLKIILIAINNYSNLSAVGISTTGSVDTNGIVLSAGHFEGYANISWDEIIRSKYRNIKKVRTTNDGKASAWGEYISSGIRNKSLIHVVVGTGVGGGLIYRDELLLGDSGMSGYIGHIKIATQNTIICSCGKQGCLETLASARGIVQHYKEIIGDDSPNDFGSILSLAGQGNLQAIQALKTGGHWLGMGIGNVMNILNPSVLTIGGGVISGTKDLPGNEDVYFHSAVEGAKYAAHKRIFASCDIRKALLGNDGGMIGAAYLCAYSA